MALKTLKRGNQKDLKWPKIIIAVLSTIGVVDTSSITLKGWGLFNSLSCSIGGLNTECDKVLNSDWGTIFQYNQITIRINAFQILV